VIEKLGGRGGRMLQMHVGDDGRVRLEYLCPSRGLIGYRSELLTDTRGTGILNHAFKEYGPWAGAMKGRQNGVLIAQDAGTTNTYGLFYLQERGPLFLGPMVKVYGGQIVGMHSATTTSSSTRRRPRSSPISAPPPPTRNSSFRRPAA